MRWIFGYGNKLRHNNDNLTYMPKFVHRQKDYTPMATFTKEANVWLKRQIRRHPNNVICYLYVCNNDDARTGIVLAIGVSFCNPVDKYDKEIGEKLAFQQAVNQLCITPDEKASIWESYISFKADRKNNKISEGWELTFDGYEVPKFCIEKNVDDKPVKKEKTSKKK